MNQDKKAPLSEQSDNNSQIPSIQKDLALPQYDLEIDLQETEEMEEEQTFQRRPQFRINENTRRRSF
jgi:hypothetical protein